jgi:hypothetical protein
MTTAEEEADDSSTLTEADIDVLAFFPKLLLFAISFVFTSSKAIRMIVLEEEKDYVVLLLLFLSFLWLLIQSDDRHPRMAQTNTQTLSSTMTSQLPQLPVFLKLHILSFLQIDECLPLVQPDAPTWRAWVDFRRETITLLDYCESADLVSFYIRHNIRRPHPGPAFSALVQEVGYQRYTRVPVAFQVIINIDMLGPLDSPRGTNVSVRDALYREGEKLGRVMVRYLERGVRERQSLNLAHRTLCAENVLRWLSQRHHINITMNTLREHLPELHPRLESLPHWNRYQNTLMRTVIHALLTRRDMDQVSVKFVNRFRSLPNRVMRLATVGIERRAIAALWLSKQNACGIISCGILSDSKK